MTREKPTEARGAFATIIATAAVTLAIGVTVAAVGGYLGTPGVEKGLDSDPGPKVSPGPVWGEGVELRSRPDVVLVPVAPDSWGADSVTANPTPVPGPIFASYGSPGGKSEVGELEPEENDEDDEDDGDEEDDDDGRRPTRHRERKTEVDDEDD